MAKATPNCSGQVLPPAEQIACESGRPHREETTRLWRMKCSEERPGDFPMRIKSMQDLLLEQTRNLDNHEERLTKALPKMAEAATSPELRSALEDHLVETRGQLRRLEQVFAEMGEDPKAETCEAMKGLIKEGEEIID